MIVSSLQAPPVYLSFHEVYCRGKTERQSFSHVWGYHRKLGEEVLGTGGWKRRVGNGYEGRSWAGEWKRGADNGY